MPYPASTVYDEKNTHWRDCSNLMTLFLVQIQMTSNLQLVSTS